MNFKELCDLEASKIIEESIKEPINELYGQYKIRIQIIKDGEIIDQQVHNVSGDEAVWNKFQQLNQQFLQNESVITEEVLYENLEKMFGNIGVYIKDYFMRKQNPGLEAEAPHGGLTKHNARDLANMVLHNLNKFNPRLATAIKIAKEHSSSPQEFLANVKGLAYNYQQYK